DAVPAAQDGFDQWDFDQKPRAISRGVRVAAIYADSANQIPNTSDWSDSTSAQAGDSIWFPSNPTAATGMVNIPLDATDADGNRIMFQLSPDDCDPSVVGEDC